MLDSQKNNSLYNPLILKGRFYPEIKAYYFREWNDFKMKFHSHNAVEIMYVISGNCLIETKNSSFKMNKGEFILLDANILHKLNVEKDKPCRMLNVEFGFCMEQQRFPSYAELVGGCSTFNRLISSNQPYVVLRDTDEVYITLKSLINELDRNDNKENFLVQLLFEELLVRISRIFCEENVEIAGKSVIHVKRAMQFIHQHYDRNLHIRDIAKAVNVHPGYLQRIFKNSKGITINDYLFGIRMEKAKTLLVNTDIPVTDIPCYIGISSRHYFSYVFKKYSGVTPASYRSTTLNSNFKY